MVLMELHQKLARIGLGIACIGVVVGAFEPSFGLIGISLGALMFGIAALIAPSA
jgi:hypothetical protein